MMNEPTDKAQQREMGNEPRFPTSHDLLYLAVQLAGNNKFKRDEADEYVQRAFWLWMAADKFASSEYIEGILTPKRNQYSKGKKGDQKYSQDLQEYHRANEDFFRQVNLPKKYPINLDKMLTLVLPKRQPAERLKIYRDFIRHNIRTSEHAHKAENIDISKVPLPGIAKVSDIVKSHRNTIAIVNESEFIVRASTLFSWYKNYLELSKKERAKKGRRASDAKKVQKNSSS